VLAARGAWVTNEKYLIERAGLREVDVIIGKLTPSPERLTPAVTEAETLLEQAVNAARR